LKHLNDVHQHDGCDQLKRPFRRHSKHSHVSKSGRWANRLRRACMKDETRPVQIAYTLRSSQDAIRRILKQVEILNDLVQDLTEQFAKHKENYREKK
jgi:hypothetical protein